MSCTPFSVLVNFTIMFLTSLVWSSAMRYFFSWQALLCFFKLPRFLVYSFSVSVTTSLLFLHIVHCPVLGKLSPVPLKSVSVPLYCTVPYKLCLALSKPFRASHRIALCSSKLSPFHFKLSPVRVKPFSVPRRFFLFLPSPLLFFADFSLFL